MNHHFTTIWNRIGRTLSGILWLVPASSAAADLKLATLQQWKEYIKTVDARNQEDIAGPYFLSSDRIPGQTARIRAGEIVVQPARTDAPIKVESGLIHHWTGSSFIPDTTLTDVLFIVRDCDRYKDVYHPNVIESKLISATDSRDEFSMVIMNKSILAKVALDSEYACSYTRVDEHRWYSISDTIRTREIADYDTASQHVLPETHGTGLIWRLHSIARFEERDGGVYIELETVALSRDIPSGLRWFIDPIVRRVSRSSLMTLLRQTQSAVRLHSASMTTSLKHAAGNATAAGPAQPFR